MKTAVLISLALYLAAGSGYSRGYSRDQSRPSGTIVGRVVDAVSKRPVSGLPVRLSRDASSDLARAGTALPNDFLTGPDGQFAFTDLVAGSYYLSTSGTSHIPGSFGQATPLGPGDSIVLAAGQTQRVTVRIWPYASISGTVRGTDGELLPGIPVRTFRRVASGNRMRLDSPTFANSDDRGRFTFSNLLPGEYTVGILPTNITLPLSAINDSLEQGSGDGLNANERIRDSGGPSFVGASGLRIDGHVIQQGRSFATPWPAPRLLRYPPVFYPNQATPETATTLSVVPGDSHGGIDIRLSSVATVSVSGTLRAPDGPGAYYALKLFAEPEWGLQSESLSQVAVAVADRTGRFKFLGVPPGGYVLRVYVAPYPGSSGRAVLWAKAPIVVGDHPIDDLAIELRPGLSIRGNVRADGALAITPAQLTGIVVGLRPVAGGTTISRSSARKTLADGSFQSDGYSPGVYRVVVGGLPTGWSIASLMYAGIDLTMRPLELDTSDLSDIRIELTDRSTNLAGRVDSASGPAEVLVFTADGDSRRLLGLTPEHTQAQRTTSDGRFSIQGLRAGKYLAVAVPSEEAALLQPDAYERLAQVAVPIELRWGATTQTVLRLSRPK
jgi:hypothetical protein